MSTAASVQPDLRPAPIIAGDAVRVAMEAPVLVDQAPPSIREWGRYRMPKVWWLPDGELGLSFQMGRDHYCDQGLEAPLFRSRDQGRTWRRDRWPLPGFNGHPVISRVHDGEFWCFPSGTGLEYDRSRMPKPVISWASCAEGFPLYRLADFPEDVQRWYQDLKAFRWTPATRRWTEERVSYDHRGQLVFSYDDTPQKIPGLWGQKVYAEIPVVRLGSELVHVDYWTQYLDEDGKPPRCWECTLMVSQDNGRSWRRRGTLAKAANSQALVEPIVERTLTGDLVAVMRVDGIPNHPMTLVHSRDQGRTWSEMRSLHGYGVFPQLLQLENGVLVLAYGRAPGTWLTFSLDGGHSWTKPHALLEESDEVLRTLGSSDGYPSLAALGRDAFIVAYGDRHLPNATGERAKAILTRRVEVRPR
jgi:hypothetical protein